MFTLASHISRNFYHELFKYPNVVGMGAGFKFTNDFTTLIPSLNIFVSKKYPKDSFSKQNLLPKHFMGSITDVVETGTFETNSLLSKIRPVQMGYGIYNDRSSSVATAGCIVLRKDPKPNPQAEDTYTSFILSNAHFATSSFTIENPIGIKIYQPQPGLIRSLNAIGEVFECSTVLPKTNDFGPLNYVDACLIKLMPASIATMTISKIGVPVGITNARVNMGVQLCGAISELKTGQITNIDATIGITINSEKKIIGIFKNLIVTSPMTAQGDSGAALLTMNNKILGLHFSGSNEVSLHNNIFDVMKYMDVIPYIQK